MEAYISSDEGVIMQINLLAKDTSQYDTVKSTPLLKEFEYERSYRPCLNFQKHPRYNGIMLTVHDFHFSIWKVGLDRPIYRSAYLTTSAITAGCFSPTRPGNSIISRCIYCAVRWECRHMGLYGFYAQTHHCADEQQQLLHKYGHYLSSSESKQ